MAEPKVYSIDEIKRIAPGYRGKPQNFDPTRVGKKDEKRAQKPKEHPKQQRPGPTSPELPPPTNPQRAPTSQRNESIISESIFGVDVSVTEIAPRQEFSASYNRVIDVSLETFQNLRADEKQLDRTLMKEEMAYYATSLLWMRLLDIKAKEGTVNLTSEEKAIRKAVTDEQFNVPQPLFAILSQTGNFTDKMGKETRHQIPNLPTTVVQGMGGYHSSAITVDTHNLFEEVPSLGIAGDMVMTLARAEPEPVPNFRIGTPPNSQTTENLAGNTVPIGPRRPEIIQRLAGYGITADHFQEYVSGTRFNLKYVKSLSDIIGKFETFRIEKVCFKALSLSGGETQVITSRPKETEEPETWNTRSVQTSSSATSSTANMGAAFCFGFQTFKEDGPGETRREKTRNWSCLTGTGTSPWRMPDEWYNNRNERRNLPEGVGTERFRAISLRQDYQLANTVRRMIKTPR
jgi:hypothetical protein